MKLFNILAILITLSAGFSYLNHRFFRLPNTIGLMVIALLVSLGLAALGPFGFGLQEDAHRLLASIDFDGKNTLSVCWRHSVSWVRRSSSRLSASGCWRCWASISP